MGLIRLTLPASQRIALDWVDLVYMAGMDGVPSQAEITIEGNEIQVRRESDESGKVFVPIRFDDGSFVLMPTGTLIERDEPYRLIVELARGSLDRLRNQFDLWFRCGFEFEDSISEKIARATKKFCEAIVTRDSDEYLKPADEALSLAHHLMGQLSDSYNQSVIELRLNQVSPLETLFGCTRSLNSLASPNRAETDQQCDDLSNAVNIPLIWRQLEPTEDQFDFEPVKTMISEWRALNKRIILGPIIRIDERFVPDYILDSDKFDHVRTRLAKFVSKVVEETSDSVDVIQVFGGLNSVDDLSLPADYRLRLAIDSIEAARSVDSSTPMIIGFDQPWSEAKGTRQGLSPLQCADAIVRANLNLNGFLIELNWGVTPSGAVPRDPLQIHTLFDLWSQFDLPVFVRLAIPSGNGTDENAFRDDNALPLAEEETALAYQAKTAVELCELMLAKPIVQGIFWAQMSDAEEHRFKNCGLIDSSGNIKPSLESWKQIRDQYLN